MAAAMEGSSIVEGVVVEVLAALGLAHVRALDGAVYGFNRNTPGVTFDLLREGQRWRCEVAEKLHRVMRAELIS